jgi:hypothetical protein
MKTILNYILVISHLISLSISAQHTKLTTLSGFIYDFKTGETMIGANIFIPKLERGTSSNQYGFYSITVPKGKYLVEVSYVGFQTEVFSVNLDNSTKVDVKIKSTSLEVDEVVVEAERADENIKSTKMGTMDIVPNEIDKVPVLFGEKDILKTIQLLPGVSSAGEGQSGFIVRGGSTDQNLIILDEAPIYNPSHLLGFFSVFNSDAIKNAKVVKGISGPEYGGRLSSVLDISMKDGNKKDFNYTGGIGLIASRLTVEGPIEEDFGSFILSGRRTYADLFFPLLGQENLNNSTLYFYDLNGKINYLLGENDRLFLSGYTGRDVFDYANKFGFDWGNTTATLRWNHIFNEKLFSNSTLLYSNYNYDINIQDSENSVTVKSGIEDINFETDFQYYLNSNNTFKFGLNMIYHTFKPGEIVAEESSVLNSKKVDDSYALESSAYVGHEWKITELLKIDYGLRYSNFLLFGPAEVNEFNREGDVIFTTSYEKGEIIKAYDHIEPRISANYLLDETSSVKFGYARNTQSIHLLSTSTTSTPLDIWQPSKSIIQPQTSDLFSIGFFKNYNDNMFQTSIEFYYKDMKNLIEYKDGADIFLNDYIEAELVFGRGWSYGMELLVEKKMGKFTGWLGYTLSKTERQFDKINDGNPFPARHDRTHDFSIIGIYDLNDKWSFSANWIYYTGDAATFPSGKYEIDGITTNLYTERNGYRMPDYHRLDLGATYYFAKSTSEEMSLTLSIYNAYAKENAYSISFEPSETNPNITEAVKLALFSIVPSLSFNFRF